MTFLPILSTILMSWAAPAGEVVPMIAGTVIVSDLHLHHDDASHVNQVTYRHFSGVFSRGKSTSPRWW